MHKLIRTQALTKSVRKKNNQEGEEFVSYTAVVFRYETHSLTQVHTPRQIITHSHHRLTNTTLESQSIEERLQLYKYQNALVLLATELSF